MIYFIVAKRRRSGHIPSCLIGVVISNCKQVKAPVRANRVDLVHRSGKKVLQREPNTQVKWLGSKYGCWK